MEKVKKYFIFAVLLFALTSCETLKVVHYGTSHQKMKKVVILSAMIDRIYQPPIPLIDAGIFNGKTNKISNEIIILQQTHVNEYRETLANSFLDHFDCQVVYGESLHDLPEYKHLLQELNMPGELYTGNDNFPMITISEGDMNPFSYNGERVQRFFQQEQNYKHVIGKIAHKLKTDYVVISISQLSVDRVGMFGMDGSLSLLTKLYIFNHEGKLVSEASNKSKNIVITGKNPEQYNAVLGNFSYLIMPMMDGIEAKYKANNPVASEN